MYIAILGRQPNLSMAELESRFGSKNTQWLSSSVALINTDHRPDIQQFGGIIKFGKVTIDTPSGNWRRISEQTIKHYCSVWSNSPGKITLGISVYGFTATPREVQRVGLSIKSGLKRHKISLRLIPNSQPQLNTATSHHNKLGLSPNKIELMMIRGKSGRIIIAESAGSQNITALARRDQARPRRDAFVGMLPPKLAMLMINLARGAGQHNPASSQARLLDPFCGTGVILQEASLMGHPVYGTDLSDKMVQYSEDNIKWLSQSHGVDINWQIHQGDAMTTTWNPPIDFVASETYLGQPFSAPPSPQKLTEVKKNVDYITTTFLKNIHPQLPPGTPLCLAVPAWRDSSGNVTQLPLVSSMSKLGYKEVKFENIDASNLLYYREDQVVARQLLVLLRA